MTLQSDRAGNIMVIKSFAKRTRPRCHFLGGSDARVIISLDEAAVIRDCGPAITAVLTPPNRQRRRLCSCGPFGASTRELATNNGRPLQNYRPS